MTVTVTGNLVKATLIGGTASGPVSVPGLEVGDVVFTGVFTVGTTTTPTDWQPFISSYEKVISVADEFQQINPGDLSVLSLTLYLLRGL